MSISFSMLSRRSPSDSTSPGGAILRAVAFKPIPLLACLVYFAFSLYSLFWIGVFFGLVRPWINGDIIDRIGADSDRYWAAARMLFDPQHNYAQGLITFQANYLGPVLEAAVLKHQSLVVAFNFAILLLAVKVASTIRGVTAYVFLALLMVNVETGVALITLNKEIFGIISAVLVAKYLLSDKRSFFLLGLATATALITRWEEAAVVLLVAWFTRKRSFFSTRHKLAVVYVIAGITVAYPLIARFMANNLGAFTQYLQGANTVAMLERLQENFGFPVVLLPKILLNLLGQLAKPTYYLGPFWTNGFVDIHSQIFLPLFSIALIILLFVARSRGKLAITRPLAFLMFVYMITIAVTPFVQPRYEFFVYVLLCLELSRSEDLEPATVMA